MNPKAQSATSSATRSSDGVQAPRLQSFPDPAGEMPALPTASPLSSISHRSPVESCAFYSIRLLSSKRRAAAFTLLEVLVASAIMGIVMFVLVSTANTSLQLWRGTSGKMAVDREGRTGLALLGWDLQNIVQPSNAALRPWINTNLFTTGTAEYPVLRFLTLKPADYQGAADLGDVCYVEYRFTNNSLMRAFVGSALTFESLTNSPPTFPTNAATNFETLVPNVWTAKFWGHQSGNITATFDPSTGEQNNPAQALRSIEYRLGILDQKFMDTYRSDPSLAALQGTNSLKWYQAIQPVAPPTP